MSEIHDSYEHGYVSGQKAMRAHLHEYIKANVMRAAEKIWSANSGNMYLGPSEHSLKEFVNELLTVNDIDVAKNTISPAPWTVVDPETDDCTYGIDDKNGNAVVYFGECADGIPNIHDAYLIAAAPDLLEFAKWVLTLKPGGLIEGRVEEVIAKATKFS